MKTILFALVTMMTSATEPRMATPHFGYDPKPEMSYPEGDYIIDLWMDGDIPMIDIYDMDYGMHKVTIKQEELNLFLTSL